MIVPFRDHGHHLPGQTYFNHVHSSSRMVIDRAFGLLKRRFRRLQKLEMHNIEYIPRVNSGACVLHNIILMKETLDLDLELWKLNLDAHVDDVILIQAQPPQADAIEKRDQFSHYIARFRH